MFSGMIMIEALKGNLPPLPRWMALLLAVLGVGGFVFLGWALVWGGLGAKLLGEN